MEANYRNDIAMQIASRATARSSAWVIVKDKKGRILLGKRSKKVGNSGEWGLFGGSVDGEEDPAKGAARELEEETGLKVSPKKLKKLWRNPHPSDDKKHSHYFFYDMRKKGKVKTNWETEKYRWFTKRGIKKLDDQHFTVKDLIGKLKKTPV